MEASETIKGWGGGGLIVDGPGGEGVGGGGDTDTWVASRAAARPWSAGSPQVCVCEVTQGGVCGSGQALCLPHNHTRAHTHTHTHTHTPHTGWIQHTG
jgi:hypothetical protein